MILTSRVVWTALEAGLFVFGLWLVAPLPVSYAGGGADDALFVRLAVSILDGRWLGPFDPYTLIKGPFYPLFLAAAAALHVPILVATQAVVLSGGLVASRVVGLLLTWRPAATFCFALLVLNPAPFDRIDSLLLREPLYAGLILLVLSLAARTWLFPPTRPLVSACLLGLISAACWMTREEGVLLVPSLCLMAGWRIVRDLAGPDRARLARRTGPLLVLPAGTCLLPILTVATLNQSHYGVFRTSDATAGPLMSAYGALASIRHHWRPTIPIPREAFAAAYHVSPAARELRPYLDGDGGRFWTGAGCRDEPIPQCDDIQAGWIMWALRGAVTAAGHYGSAREADRYYRRLGREIDAACDAGRLHCTGRHRSILPPLRPAYLPLIASDTWQVARDIAVLGPVDRGTVPTLVPPSAYSPYVRVAPNTPRSPSIDDVKSRWLKLPPGRRLVAAVLVRILPALTVVGLPLALAWTLFRAGDDLSRRTLSATSVFLVAIVAALLLRIGFLGVMQATLIPMQFRYVSPAFPLALLLVSACLADLSGGQRTQRRT